MPVNLNLIKKTIAATFLCEMCRINRRAIRISYLISLYLKGKFLSFPEIKNHFNLTSVSLLAQKMFWMSILLSRYFYLQKILIYSGWNLNRDVLYILEVNEWFHIQHKHISWLSYNFLKCITLNLLKGVLSCKKIFFFIPDKTKVRINVQILTFLRMLSMSFG